MSRLIRNSLNSTFFHIMIQGVNKEFIFNSNIDKKIYFKIVKKQLANFNLSIIAYCIMGNHVHLLINTKDIKQMSRFMQKTNSIYAIIYNKRYNRVGHLFRDRYKSEAIKSLRQLYCCINYIHNNPVKAKMCKTPIEYPYSSYREYVHGKEIIDEDIIVEYLGKNFLKELEIVKEKEFTFIDEEDKEKLCDKLINDFLKENNVSSLINLKYDENKIVELIKLLQANKISNRMIERKIGIGREKIKNLTPKGSDPFGNKKR